MKIRILFLFRFFIAAIFVGIVAKLGFLLYNGSGMELGVLDVLNIVWHGLPLDCSFAGYMAALLWIVLLAAYWIGINRWVFYLYFGFVALLQSIIYVVDTGLFAFWHFKLDATIFTYLDSPTEVMASVSTMYVVAGVTIILTVAVALYLLFRRTISLRQLQKIEESRLGTPKRVIGTLMHVLCGGILFLSIRGGVDVSTANPGMVYFSDNAFLNASAVNPAFNLFYSMSKVKDFSKRHQHFDAAEFSEQYAALAMNTQSQSTTKLITTDRPNVMLVVLEGCGRSMFDAADVMPRMKAVAAEGVEFTNCFANSFRTDRGVVCTLSGYPSYPDVSVMKLTESKVANLPSIARSLQRNGYSTEFLYGGDINFTNTNGYLLSTGYQRTYGEAAFPAEERNDSKWGVHDEFAFNRALKMMEQYPADKPWMLTLLTLSSHEPWEVPYERLGKGTPDNAFAYLDECVGNFIDRFKKMAAWQNTLIVIIPDHGVALNLSDEVMAIEKNRIPLILTGGAVAQPAKIDILCNQSDLAATLLGQLGIDHADFPMSRDVLSTTYTYPFAINTWSQGVVWVDSWGASVYDLNTQKVVQRQDMPTAAQVDHIRAYLQAAYQLLK